MDELIYSINLKGITLQLEENSLGFCVKVDFVDSMDVYCFNNLLAAIEAFRSLIPVFKTFDDYDELN